MAKRNKAKVRAAREEGGKPTQSTYAMRHPKSSGTSRSSVQAEIREKLRPATRVEAKRPEAPMGLQPGEVTGLVIGKTFGGVFLRTEEGIRIYLPYVVLNQWAEDRRLKRGERLQLMAFPNEDGLRATKVLGELP